MLAISIFYMLPFTRFNDFVGGFVNGQPPPFVTCGYRLTALLPTGVGSELTDLSALSTFVLEPGFRFSGGF
ncbi:hypothetical protein [Gallaecimonas mangrovi]|uniref:hypothetical protein n=1 Tax=Gallaecimonas mangrovi TaxID=2291597 RepID=UPI000E2079A4|nr:hypothetical protein [Gallaecimonas mangrovi]